MDGTAALCLFYSCLYCEQSHGLARRSHYGGWTVKKTEMTRLAGKITREVLMLRLLIKLGDGAALDQFADHLEDVVGRLHELGDGRP